MAQSKSTDLGAALRGLILAGAVIFLLMLTIVWLTNRHFEGKKEAEGGHAPAPASAPGAGTPAIPVSPEAAAGKPGPAPPPPPAP
jgi:hypothetical protein